MRPSELDGSGQLVVVDTETTGLHPDDGARTAVIVAATDDWQVAWPFAMQDRTGGQGRLDLGDQATNLDRHEWDAALQWLAKQRLIFHNAKFDLQMLAAGTPQGWAGADLVHALHWDTMVAAKEIDPLYPTGLKAQAKRLVLETGDEDQHEQALKAWMKRNRASSYAEVPWDLMEPYALADGRLTWKLYLYQQHALDMGCGRRERVQHEIEVTRLLYQLERRGIGFDAGACLQAAGALRAERDRLAAQLPFTLTVPAAKRYFFGEVDDGGLGLVPYEVTDRGEPQLNESVLRKLVRDQVPNAELYQQCRKLEVALDMWYEGYPAKIGADGRLRTVFRQTKQEGRSGGGAVSGRFSVERINLQAIPHASKLDGVPDDVPTPRQFFRAAEGAVLWEIDLAQAELRVAADLANCGRMLELIEADADLHGETAKQLFKVDPDHPDWFRYRQISKRGNFSFIFGVGPDTFRQTMWSQAGIELSRPEAASIIEAWRRIYPEFGRAIYRAQRQMEQRGWVGLVNGGRRWLWPGEHAHKAFNQKVQGSLAEFAKQWALETERAWPGMLVLLVHDSQVMEVPESLGDQPLRDAARMVEKIGADWFKVPMSADYSRWEEH